MPLPQDDNRADAERAERLATLRLTPSFQALATESDHDQAGRTSAIVPLAASNEPPPPPRPARRLAKSATAAILLKPLSIGVTGRRLACAVLLMALAYAGFQAARGHWPSWTQTTSTVEPAPNAESRPASGMSANTGDLRIQSQPDGADVWLDGVPRGAAPLLLTGVADGFHTVVLRGPAGSVRTTVTVRAGETQQLFVPIYSGWLVVFAAVELQIREGGVVLGTSESGRLMVPPGEHEIELVSAYVGFRTTRMVTVQPGGVTPVNVSLPNTSVDIIAPSGTQVWMDGQDLGTAPLPTRSAAVGTREILARHPVLGERRQTVTLTYHHPNRVVVTFPGITD